MAAGFVQRLVRQLVGEDNNSVARFLPLEIVGANTSLEAAVSRTQRQSRAKTPSCDSKL